MTASLPWPRIKDLFRRIQDVAEPEREDWLDTHCAADPDLRAELARLLGAQRAPPGILDADATELLGRLLGDALPERRDGQHIGPYRLLRLLGEGGMGQVFLAERDEGDFVQRVALKLVRGDFAGAEGRARFLREREILARLTHPHIAQLHDGGLAADGTPYFTLEYVEGEPVTRYCDAQALSIHERLVLLLQVCAAVAYAHRNLIVHRDLKPSNIMVTADGEVKLLDFGIAKLLDAEPAAGLTQTHARLMTREYAAPEQVLGEPITTATDLYALGVLLYELLTGHLPYPAAEAGTSSWAKAIVEQAPEPLSRALRRTGEHAGASAEETARCRASSAPRLRRELRGDLEHIVQRALEKQPEARYASVGAFADDLRAWHDGRAISGGTRTYRARKFVRRHWLPLSAAALLLGVVIAGSTMVAVEAGRVERQARTTAAVKDFLLGLFTAVDPHLSKGRDVSARELLDKGAENIARDTRLEPKQLAEVKATLGRIYFQLGVFDRASALEAEAIAALAGRADAEPLLSRTQVDRARALVETGDLKSAAVLADTARRSLDAQPDTSLADRVAAITAQAEVARAQRDFVKVQRYADEELPLARRIAALDPKPLYHALMTAANASWGLGHPDVALARWQEAVAVASRNAGPDDLEVAKARGNMAMALSHESRYAQARSAAAQALATFEKVLGTDHPVTLNARGFVALYTFHLGRYREARDLFEQVLTAQRKQLGEKHPAVAGTEINLGILLIDSGDAAAAERVLGEALAIFSDKYGPDYEGARIALGDLAAAHIALGKLDQAHAEMTEVLARERKADAQSVDSIDADRLGDVERLQGDTAAAVARQRVALVAAQKEKGESSRYTASAHFYLARSLRDGGDTAGAVREYRAALVSYAGYIPNAEHPLAATVRYELGLLLLKDAATHAEAIKLLGDAATIREKFLGADSLRTREARQSLTKALAAR